MTRRLDFPLLVLIVGFGFGLAANLLSTWQGGPVRILGGALASLALPAALHMWGQISVENRWFWWMRLVAMTVIAGMAAVTTFWHASELLIAHGESVWLARAYPVMTELMVTMGVLARRRAPVETTDEAAPEPVERTTVADAVAAAEPTPPPASGWSFDDAVAWATREAAGAKRIQSHTGLSEYKAKQAAGKAKAARELRAVR